MTDARLVGTWTTELEDDGKSVFGLASFTGDGGVTCYQVNAKNIGLGNWEPTGKDRSEEHTSELQSPCNLVCRLLLEKKKQRKYDPVNRETLRVHRREHAHCRCHVFRRSHRAPHVTGRHPDREQPALL